MNQAQSFKFQFEHYICEFRDISLKLSNIHKDFIVIPTYLHSVYVHSDPEHFPEPEKFNPDRFDNPDVRNHPAYLPFGCGPRYCIGTRLATTQVRTAIVYLVKNFHLSVSSNHKPIDFGSSHMLQAKDGLLINFEMRN